MRTRTADAPSALALSNELGVTVAEVYAALDSLADTIGRPAVYTIDERVQPGAADRLRAGRWTS